MNGVASICVYYGYPGFPEKKIVYLNEYSSIFVAYVNSRNAQENCYEYAQCVRFQYKLFIRIA